MLKGFQGEARTQVMDDCFVVCCCESFKSQSYLQAENRYRQRGSYGDTEDNSSLRMIAATVLRELRLLDAINIATRRNGRGGSDYKLLEQLGGHVEDRLSSS